MDKVLTREEQLILSMLDFLGRLPKEQRLGVLEVALKRLREEE